MSFLNNAASPVMASTARADAVCRPVMCVIALSAARSHREERLTTKTRSLRAARRAFSRSLFPDLSFHAGLDWEFTLGLRYQKRFAEDSREIQLLSSCKTISSDAS